MRRITCVLFLMIYITITSFACSYISNEKNNGMSDADTSGFAVVELFTSEGCSSCPPADAVVAKLLKRQEENVYVLGFHVDYWNYLGWKDNFSSKTYSTRQQQYAGIFHLNSVYTPQVVVNGEKQFVGSDEKKLQGIVTEDLNKTSSNTLQVTATAEGKNVNIYCKTNAGANNKLNVALVQMNGETKVDRGENGGRILHHVNIVRGFKTVNIQDLKGSINLTLPSGLTTKEFVVIAFVQDPHSFKITAAAKTGIE